MSLNSTAFVVLQLRRLTSETGGWDWNTFAPTLIATLLGGLLGVFGIWLGYRWQSKHRYREVVDDCVVRVLEQIASHAISLHQLQRQRELVDSYSRLGADFFARTGQSALDEPADFNLSMTLDIAQMRARGGDQVIVTEAIRAYSKIREETRIDVRVQMFSALGGALSRWRSGIWSPLATRERLERLSAFTEPFDADLSSKN